ncbi:MAG: copper resistance system multicopper oxidase [Alphaproteobacteria bacterium]|nr:copper resistance system multicopper oxidase [Alphaproteobacteria bacterium]
MRKFCLGIAFLTLLISGSGTFAGAYDLTIDKMRAGYDHGDRLTMAINAQIPGPVLRFTEGEDVIINVTNKMDTDTSIHWHGILLPFRQDGVPGVSFPGIKPGETFTYHFRIRQAGTYWYHSHSGLQEQEGLYGPIIIAPVRREPFKYDRDYVVMLSDWTDEKPEAILGHLKKNSDYYNYAQRTVGTFFKDVSDEGLGAAIKDRLAWGRMRMAPTDIADVSSYTFLINGKSAGQNWTGLFKPGERVRLRLINGSSMSIFDVRIPGLKMTVVQADGNNVQPVPVDELRVAVAETYDVIVQPKEEKPYTVFAESLDRTGYARGTLATKEGMNGEIPALRPRPLLTMTDMGMDMGDANNAPMAGMEGMDIAGMDREGTQSGLAPKAAEKGGKALVYGDLKSMTPYTEYRAPDRVIEMKLTGNMQRYFWSINGRRYSEAEPIRLKYGERVRFTFVNQTMMSHPMHLHGMWMQLDNGHGKFSPLKHVVNVMPDQTLSVDVPANAMGEWVFHCHLLYHMMSGMMRKVIVEAPVAAAMETGRE